MTVDSLNTVAGRIIGALSTAGLDVHDTQPHAPPAGPYVLVTGDGGLNLYEALCGTPRRRLHTILVMAVGGAGGTPAATRHTADKARVAIDALPGMRQAGTGPILTDGPPADRRHSITLTYQTRA